MDEAAKVAQSGGRAVRPVLVLAALVLLLLGAAKLVGVGRGEGEQLQLSSDSVAQWERWARWQGAGELVAGALVLVLPNPAGSLVLGAVGAGFLAWQFLETPGGVPCPCLAGLRSWISWLREQEEEWRTALATWFFLVGVLSWRSARTGE
ncbi:MAG: hypothetical protein WHT82_03795 [Limisphaera sp.]